MDALRADGSGSVADLQQSHAADIKRAKAEAALQLDARITELSAAHATARQQLRQEHAAAMAQLQAGADARAVQAAELLQQQVGSMEAAHKERIRALEGSGRDADAAWARDKAALQAQAERTLAAETDRANKQEGNLNSEISSLRSAQV